MFPSQKTDIKQPSIPLVSIVVTTKNEEMNIDACLRSIQNQSYFIESLEIIVVDNNSSDKTRDIARRYTDKIFIKGPERSAQRNYGMRDIASGEYVMFVDADMIFSPSLIEACVETAHKGEFVALHIPEIVLGKNFFSRVRRFERSFYNGTVIDGARFFKKQAFVGVGGFDETLSGPEDWDIDKKIKKTGQIGLVSEPLGAGKQTKPWVLSDFILKRGVSPDCYGSVIYHNEAEFNLVKYLSKKGYYSHSMGTYASKWGASDPDIKKQLGLFYRFIGVFVENGKWKRLISHPILMLGMYFLRFLVGSTFLLNKGTQ